MLWIIHKPANFHKNNYSLGQSGEINWSSSTAVSKPADIIRCLMNSARRILAWLPISWGCKALELPKNTLYHYVNEYQSNVFKNATIPEITENKYIRLNMVKKICPVLARRTDCHILLQWFLLLGVGYK